MTAPLPEEAARLVEAVHEWAARALPADDGCTCTWCPVCRGLAVLRGERPEVTERLTEAVAAAAGALSALASALSRPPAGAPRPAPEPDPTPDPERVVVLIPVDDEA